MQRPSTNVIFWILGLLVEDLLGGCCFLQGRRQVAKKLDRAMVDVTWQRMFPDAFLDKVVFSFYFHILLLIVWY